MTYCVCEEFISRQIGECIKYIQKNHSDREVSDYAAFIVIMQYALSVARINFNLSFNELMTEILSVFPEFKGVLNIPPPPNEFKETIN
jgi:hypothetical protein